MSVVAKTTPIFVKKRTLPIFKSVFIQDRPPEINFIGILSILIVIVR